MCVEWKNISTKGILQKNHGGLSPFSLVLEAGHYSGFECKLWSQAGMSLKLDSVTYKIYELII